MRGRYAELRYYGVVQGNSADMEHIGILLNTLYVANMLFKQVFVLVGVMVFRRFDG